MKLKKLTIDNIASIEHAEIDFNDSPLAGERLFLITGETGSGKTTIIDCLCLALYGITPRLNSAKGSDYTIKRQENEEALRTNGVKQLLRRGAVSADVKLTFDDNEGTPYIASWHIHRARNKVNGNIMNPERSIETDEGAADYRIYTKKNDLDRFAKETIGLDMNQFFRTVVLAQGKFAEFLNSDDNDKAALLEKMTGTEVYAQVGSKIFETCRNKEAARNALRDQLQNIVLLTDEAIAGINEEMASHSRDQEALFKQNEGAQKMIQWLDNKARNEKDLAGKRRDLADKQAKTQEADYIEKRQLATDWDATIDARRELQESQRAQRQIQQLMSTKPALQEEFDTLCAALRAAIDSLKTQEAKLKAIDSFLQQEAPNSEMYKAIKSIKALIKQRCSEQDNIGTFTRALEQDRERLPKVQQSVDTTLQALQRQEAVVKQLEEQYNAIDVKGINGLKDDLGNARQALLQLKAANDATGQATDTLNDTQAALDRERQTLEKAQATLGDKTAIAEQAREAVERETDWNNLLQQAHKTLHQGDSCPVCGNTIETLLAPKGDNVLEGLRARLKQAEGQLQKTQAEIAASDKAISQLEQQQAKAQKLLDKKVAERAELWEVTDQKLAQCGLPTGQRPDNDLADELISSLDKKTEELNGTLRQASDLNNHITEERKRLTTCTEQHSTAKIDLNNVTESIKHQQEAIAHSKKQVKAITDELDALFTIKDWQQQMEGQQDFIDELERLAASYQNRVNEGQQLREAISRTAALIPAMQDAKKNIEGLTDHGKTIATAPANIDEQWRQFENKFINWNNLLNNEHDKERQARQALNRAMEANQAIDMQRLAMLTSYRQDDIDSIKSSQQKLTEAITHVQGEISALERQQEEIANTKPDFPEENRERLEDICQTCQSRHQELTMLIAQLKAQLDTDEANRKVMGEKKEALDKAEADLSQWAVMNEMLGDAQGNKFRKIAQSYILGELLSRANGYLKQFNDRYVLEANPGTLVILVRDQMQGDLTSVNTLSGGESFMVSLALALALSSTSGKMFSVDTLFIDEGFGSLSPNYLEGVMETLNRLYEMGGKRVGIISHVEMLKERVTTQIQVIRDPKDNTVSRVKVVS